jgi:hypothetical protein
MPLEPSRACSQSMYLVLGVLRPLSSSMSLSPSLLSLLSLPSLVAGLEVEAAKASRLLE